jgi:hypothetical protein
LRCLVSQQLLWGLASVLIPRQDEKSVQSFLRVLLAPCSETLTFSLSLPGTATGLRGPEFYSCLCHMS